MSKPKPYVDVGRDMRWPGIGRRLLDAEWTLRYGEPTREDLLFAASILNAYRSLVLRTEKVRAEIVRELRAAEAAEKPEEAP